MSQLSCTTNIHSQNFCYLSKRVLWLYLPFPVEYMWASFLWVNKLSYSLLSTQKLPCFPEESFLQMLFACEMFWECHLIWGMFPLFPQPLFIHIDFVSTKFLWMHSEILSLSCFSYNCSPITSTISDFTFRISTHHFLLWSQMWWSIPCLML
jgi:hypothetical protein